jgi:hypothetical protein
MRKLFILLSVLIVFAFVYYLVYYSITSSKPQDSSTSQSSEGWKMKLSMKQIDSLTSVENYVFTIENYSRDAANLKADSSKTKRI